VTTSTRACGASWRKFGASSAQVRRKFGASLEQVRRKFGAAGRAGICPVLNRLQKPNRLRTALEPSYEIHKTLYDNNMHKRFFGPEAQFVGLRKCFSRNPQLAPPAQVWRKSGASLAQVWRKSGASLAPLGASGLPGASNYQAIVQQLAALSTETNSCG
jgi:hypothetical protein